VERLSARRAFLLLGAQVLYGRDEGMFDVRFSIQL